MAKRQMPAQRPGRSKQNYATPADCIRAVKALLGIDAFAWDFAAEPSNAKARYFYTEQDDALSAGCDWVGALRHGGWGWLNPPFGDIDPWAAKCARSTANGGQIAFLVPASVGSNWYARWIHDNPRALTVFLNGRLCFIDDWPHTIDPSPRNTTGACYKSAPLYPKDCMLILFGVPNDGRPIVWQWQESLARLAVADRIVIASARATEARTNLIEDRSDPFADIRGDHV